MITQFNVSRTDRNGMAINKWICENFRGQFSVTYNKWDWVGRKVFYTRYTLKNVSVDLLDELKNTFPSVEFE